MLPYWVEHCLFLTLANFSSDIGHIRLVMVRSCMGGQVVPVELGTADGGLGMDHHVQGDAAHCGGSGCVGHAHRGRTIRIWCDMSVVAIVKSGSYKESRTMHLRSFLAYLEAVGKFVLLAKHLRGEDNVVADQLSRGNSSSVMQGLEEHWWINFRQRCGGPAVKGKLMP